MSFDAEDWDTDAIHDTGGDQTLFTIPQDGHYLLCPVLRATNNYAWNNSRPGVEINGTDYNYDSKLPERNGGLTTWVYNSGIQVFELSTSDQVKMFVRHHTDDTGNANYADCAFTVQKVPSKGARVLTTVGVAQNHAIHVLQSFETVTYDNTGYYSGASPTKLTVPTGYGGKHLISTFFSCTGGATPRHLWIRYRVNGGSYLDLSRHDTSWLNTQGDYRTGGFKVVNLSDGDEVEISCYQINHSGHHETLTRCDFMLQKLEN
jgi:hypothetical protein